MSAKQPASTSPRSSELQWVIAPTEPIEKYYTLGRRLGQPGQFGYAVHAVHRTIPDCIRAVKVISKARFTRHADIKYHFDQLRSEIRVMQKLSHPNIVRLYEVYESQSDLFLVMEYCSGGELFDRIKDAGAFSEKQAASILRQMCEGLKYMHENGVAHCDLKPDNFLFLNEGETIKIIDFGMSKFVQTRKYFQVICGTPYYVAPEVVMGKYSEHADMWSLGVVMFVSLFGYPCFYVDQDAHGAETDNKIFELISKGFSPVTKAGYGAHFPASIPCSESAKDLMAKLLNSDAASRLTAEEALSHPWLSGRTASDKPILSNVLRSLAAFHAKHKFKVSVLNMMASSLSEEEIEQLKATFKSMDTDGDGTITLSELHQAVQRGDANLVASADEIERLMKLADIDGDGRLSYEELLLTCVQRKLNAKEERIWAAFCKLDVDGNGRITRDEIETVLKANSQVARQFIEEIDTDGDGTVSYGEFLAMWRKIEQNETDKNTPRE